MKALKQLDADWQDWIKVNIARGVPVTEVANTMSDKGWVEAAYELLSLNTNDVKRPFIDTLNNQIKLTDKTVSLSFICHKPFVTIISDFLSAKECEAIIEDADKKLEVSKVINPEDGSFVEHNERTSTSTGYQRGESKILKTVESRIAEIIHWPVENGEGVQVLRYENGGEYRPHFDFFDPSIEGSTSALKTGGQRVGTFLMYLSDVDTGGSTRFPNLNFEVKPKLGTAVYFANTDLDGNIDKQTLHAGLPVTKGVKYMATKWLREKPYV